jgi:arylsulfatase A-like enzyme
MKQFLVLLGIGAVVAGVVVAVENSESKVQTPAVLDAPIPYLDYGSPANPNGSFEAPVAGAPDGWTVTGGRDLRWERDGGAAHSGSQSMLLRQAGAKPAGAARLVSLPFEVGAGDVVKFSAWVLGTGTGTPKPPDVRVEALVGNQWLPMDPRPNFLRAPMGSWFPLASSVVAPVGATQVRLVASADGTISDGDTVWRLDDFHCRVISLRAYVEGHRDAARLPDVLLLGADTLRQSPLGCYGSTTVYTPNLDLLAHEGVLFRHAMASSSWTRPSFASIFTSLYPSQHTAELHSSVLPDSVTTLAELLRVKGYFTAGFAKTRFDGFVGPGAGFAKGFDLFFHADDETAVDEAFEAFLKANADELSSLRGGGLFIFRHFYEPHATYDNRWPDVIVNRGLLGTRDLDGATLFTALYPQKPGVANAEDVEYARRIYESQANEVDTLVGAILARLRSCGLYERLNVILCSDHGESFNERPGTWNHANPYNTCTEVPLIMRLPGRTPAGLRVEDRVASNLDIMPTILDVAGIEPPPQLEGMSLLRPEQIPGGRLVASEDRKSGSISIRGRRYKLVALPVSLPRVSGRDPYEYWKSIQPGVIETPLSVDLLEGPRDWVLLGGQSPTRFALYDLDADPFEKQDIARENAGEFRSLLIELLAHCARTRIFSLEELRREQQFDLSGEELARIETTAKSGPAPTEHIPSAIELTPDTLESLRNQGYLN